MADEFGLVIAANRPMAVKIARPAMPRDSLRMAAAPISAAKSASTTKMPLTRTSLSFEPKDVIAKSFRNGGVKSIDMLPTATTGEPSGPVNPATSCPTPIATAPVSSPAISPRLARRLSFC
jgi:hypothetical protein